MKKLLLIGGGGHCHSVIDSILSSCEYEMVGIIDYENNSYLDIDVIGNDDDLPRLRKSGWDHAFITVGSVGDTKLRRRLFEMVKSLGFNVVTVIDPSAVVARGTYIAEGVFIGKNAVVNSGSSIQECAIINTGAIIEHDCNIGAFAHISPGTVLCGQVNVGNDAHVGAGSTVIQQVNIGNSTLIGAGSVVVKDVPATVRAYGSPCKVVTK